MKDPDTPEEWQEAVDAAQLYLMLDAAREYGLVTGGPKVKVDFERCSEILLRGEGRGVVPFASRGTIGVPVGRCGG